MVGSGLEGASSAVWMVAKTRSQPCRATRCATPRRDFPVAMPNTMSGRAASSPMSSGASAKKGSCQAGSARSRANASLYASTSASIGPCAPTRAVKASARDRPTTDRERCRLGGSRPCAAKAARWAATMRCWLSTRVPSTSKTTSFTGAAVRLVRRFDDRVVAAGVEAEQIEALLHVGRQRRRHVDRLARARVRDDDAPGEEMQLLLDAAGQLPVLHVEILRIADDRVANMGGVGAQLMRAPSHRLERQPGEFLGRRLNDGVVGERMAGALVAVLGNAHARIALAHLLLGEVGGDASLLQARHAGDERPINFARQPRAECFSERRGGEARLGDDEAAGCVLVEAVDEARLLPLL